MPTNATDFTVTATDATNPDVSKNYTLLVAAAGAVLPPTSYLDTTTSPVGSGTTTGDGAYDPGAPVTVTAAAVPGYRFSNWTDNGKIVSTSATYTFNIDVNHSLIANFIIDVPQWTITTSATPAAGGTVSGGGTLDEGSNATLTATPAVGYSFSKWTEGGVQVSTSASYTFAVTADRSLVAVFTAVPTYVVSTSSNTSAWGTTTGAGSYSSGSSVTVTATPAAGYVFSKWTVGGNQVSTSASYTFTITANKTLVANFIAAGAQQTITASTSNATRGTVTGGGNYLTGDSATLVAVPNPGYAFSRWKEGNSNVSTSASYTFTVTGSRTLVAEFIEAFVITANVSPGIGGTTEMDSLTYKSESIPLGGLLIRQLDGKRQHRQHESDIRLQCHRKPHARRELRGGHRRHRQRKLRTRRRRFHQWRRHLSGRRRRHRLRRAKRRLRLRQLDAERHRGQHRSRLRLHRKRERGPRRPLRRTGRHPRQRVTAGRRHRGRSRRLRHRSDRGSNGHRQSRLRLHRLDGRKHRRRRRGQPLLHRHRRPHARGELHRRAANGRRHRSSRLEHDGHHLARRLRRMGAGRKHGFEKLGSLATSHHHYRRHQESLHHHQRTRPLLPALTSLNPH